MIIPIEETVIGDSAAQIMTALIILIRYPSTSPKIIRTTMKSPLERLYSLRCLPHGVVTARK